MIFFLRYKWKPWVEVGSLLLIWQLRVFWEISSKKLKFLKLRKFLEFFSERVFYHISVSHTEKKILVSFHWHFPGPWESLLPWQSSPTLGAMPPCLPEHDPAIFFVFRFMEVFLIIFNVFWFFSSFNSWCFLLDFFDLLDFFEGSGSFSWGWSLSFFL